MDMQPALSLILLQPVKSIKEIVVSLCGECWQVKHVLQYVVYRNGTEGVMHNTNLIIGQ